jgi:hypothetical protein
MPITIQLMTEEELLEKARNKRKTISSIEKYRMVLERKLKRERKPRKYHFTMIELNPKWLAIFDGLGKEIVNVENSVKGVRIGRACAREMFLNAPKSDINGGYLFN